MLFVEYKQTVLSFVIPAHNEELCLPATLSAIRAATAKVLSVQYEIIVVDDASTDATAEVGRQHDATVVRVNHRQIAATRNAGASVSQGERLFFVDADTTIDGRALLSALRHMDHGAVGGGAPFRFDDAPLYARVLLWWLNWIMWMIGISGGAFMFCTRSSFNAVGGFDEKLFGAEDASMAWALARHGKFVVLWTRVLTSGRRMRGTRGVRMLMSLLAMAFFPGMLTRRTAVRKVWYATREDDNETPNWFMWGAVNVLLLLIIVAFITGPLWDLIPQSLTPHDHLIGKLRIGLGVLNCHFAMVLWPCAYLIVRALLRPMRWTHRTRLMCLLALCVWFGWGAGRVVIWSWSDILRGVAPW